MSYVPITDNFSAALALHSIKQDRAMGLSTLSLKTVRQVQAYQRQVLDEMTVQQWAERLKAIIDSSKNDLAKIRARFDKADVEEQRLLLAQAQFVLELSELAVAGLQQVEQAIKGSEIA